MLRCGLNSSYLPIFCKIALLVLVVLGAADSLHQHERTTEQNLFSVARTNGWTSNGTYPLSPVNFDDMITNPAGAYNNTIHKFVARATGNYFISCSAGSQESVPLDYVIMESNVELASVYHSNSLGGPSYGGRSLFFSINNVGTEIHMMGRRNTGIYSDIDLQTAFMMFRYEDIGTTIAAFSVARTSDWTGYVSPLLFDLQILNLINHPFNMTSGKFRCSIPGIYFFTVSLGTVAGQGAHLRVNKNNDEALVGLSAMSTGTSGSTTTSRSMLVNLITDDEVYLSNEPLSSLFSDGGLQTSFIGFVYELDNAPTSAFFVARTGSWENAATYAPIIFDLQILNQAGDYNMQSGFFTCSSAGIYFFSFSAGAKPQRFVHMVLKHNGVPVGSIHHISQALDGVHTFSRDVLLQLADGDVVHVEAMGGTALYSQISTKETSFMGMRMN